MRGISAEDAGTDARGGASPEGESEERGAPAPASPEADRPRRARARSRSGRPPLSEAERQLARRDSLATPVVPQLGEPKLNHAAHVERIRALAMRIRSALRERGQRCVALVSPRRREGRTTLACNLALAMASVSPPRTVALLDLDLRAPGIAAQLDAEAALGIESVLSGAATLPDACFGLDYPSLDVFPVQRPHPAASELLSGPCLAGVIAELEQQYQMIVIDTPPALRFSDTPAILGDRVCAVSVARAGVTSLRAYQAMHRRLPEHAMIGQILNESETPVRPLEYYYYAAGEASA